MNINILFLQLAYLHSYHVLGNKETTTFHKRIHNFASARMIHFYIIIAIILVFVDSSQNPTLCEKHRNRFNISQLETVHEALSQWSSILPFILERESDEVAKSSSP